MNTGIIEEQWDSSLFFKKRTVSAKLKNNLWIIQYPQVKELFKVKERFYFMISTFSV